VATRERRVRADIVFSRAKIAVFVDGCFWHSCPIHGNAPRSNKSYWDTKLERNRVRDREQTEALESCGWAVIRVWEHEAPERVTERIAAAVVVRSSRSFAKSSRSSNFEARHDCPPP